MTREEQMRSVLGLKPGDEAREYDGEYDGSQPVIEVPGGPACDFCGSQARQLAKYPGVLAMACPECLALEFPGESSMGPAAWMELHDEPRRR